MYHFHAQKIRFRFVKYSPKTKKLNMKKIILLILFVNVTLLINAQNYSGKKYVYSETSSAAFLELYEKTKNTPEKFHEVITQIKSLESEGKIILSSTEYAPIKERIAQANGQAQNELEIELKIYAIEASKLYVVITDLIK